MAKVISIHHYILKPGVDAIEFERAIKQAREGGLFNLRGLREYHFVKGLRGARRGLYAAIWIYESREAWEALWGTPDNPVRKQDYPRKWQVWEDQILAPFLSQEPDRIEFTAYEALS